MIVPNKLKKGDEIRIIAPSRNMNILGQDCIDIATKRLEDLGLVVTYGKHVRDEHSEYYNTASIKDRVEDLHDAFKDPNVKGILTVIGGFNINQILDDIDYEIIKNNPKIICGFSDITALLDAIYQKTGLVTYYGPHFSSFGMKKGFDYTLDYFKKVLFEDEEVEIKASDSWSDDLWFIDQENRIFNENKGLKWINTGDCEGTIIGGNLCTLNLLQGTEYMPDDKDIVLFIEDDNMAGEEYLREFDRNLESLLKSLKDKNIKGVVIGRNQNGCAMTDEKWEIMLKNKKVLKNIPIVINADFGHTTPIITFPIGGKCRIVDNKIFIK